MYLTFSRTDGRHMVSLLPIHQPLPPSLVVNEVEQEAKFEN